MKIKTDLLPVGSVVKVKEYKNKVIIIQRNVIAKGKIFYDYGAALYPLGVYGDKMLYFQADEIEKIYCKGYLDQRDVDYQKDLSKKLKNIKIKDYFKKKSSLKQKILTFLHIY